MVQPVFFHHTEWPETNQALLRAAWRDRRFPAKFHYLTPLQAHRWLAVHRAHSPSRTDPGCLDIYDRIFTRAAEAVPGEAVQLCGLGSGGGMKDARFLSALDSVGASARYVPCDASPTLALISAGRARASAPRRIIRPFVADLSAMEDQESFWREGGPEQERQIFSLLGMVPNLDPGPILAKLAAWSQPGDLLVVSANLAPGPDAEAGCRAVLPQYANRETEDWLRSILEDAGLPREQIRIGFGIERSPTEPRLFRIFARAFALTDLEMPAYPDLVPWKQGEPFDLFYSNRFTPGLFTDLLNERGWSATAQELAPSGEEGVWLVTRNKDSQQPIPGLDS